MEYISTRKTISNTLMIGEKWEDVYIEAKKNGYYVKVGTLLKYTNFKGFKDKQNNALNIPNNTLIKCNFYSDVCTTNDFVYGVDVPANFVLDSLVLEDTNQYFTIPSNGHGVYYKSESGHIICEEMPTHY